MSFEMEYSKLTQAEIEDVLSKYLSITPEGIHATIEILEKLGIISEYVFKEEKKKEISEKTINEESILEAIQEWQFYWMHQVQNSEQDYENYFNRAIGIDANMRHHLAKIILKHVQEAIDTNELLNTKEISSKLVDGKDAEIKRLKAMPGMYHTTLVLEQQEEIERLRGALKEMLSIFKKELSIREDGTNLKCTCNKPDCYHLYCSAGDQIYRVSYVDAEKLTRIQSILDKESK